MTIDYKVGGTNIEAASLPSRVYFDEECRELSSIYDTRNCPDEYVPSTLGDVYAEIGVQKFLGFSKLSGKFVGVEKNELLNFLKDFAVGEYDFGFAMRSGFFRSSQINGREILFPTPSLLENQKVGKRKRK
ncbi:hypothetical protein HY449_03205 [Candidatus Pacearchaeota archaeon]|nr:hypothetical protein [Candidatus Pacearchaeota archaeon]